MDRYASIISELETTPDVIFQDGVLLSRHSSFRVGGPAALMVFPLTPDALARVCGLFRQTGEAPLTMGNGSNLLFPDEGISRPVINTSRMDAEPEILPDDRIRAVSGKSLSSIASFAAKNGLGGMEFAHGIPGTLGGAIFMNAGAYGGEMSMIVEQSRCVDFAGNIITLSGEAHGFKYRHSAIQDENLTVLDAVLRLTPGSTAAIMARMEELGQKRRASQPLEFPSAGSVFKRPENAFAAALIDEAGLKGLSVGGAMVSPKHAGFIVNTGGATCADITELIDKVRRAVFDRTGTLLETEIKLIV